jgi:hypothetical protein
MGLQCTRLAAEVLAPQITATELRDTSLGVAQSRFNIRLLKFPREGDIGFVCFACRLMWLAHGQRALYRQIALYTTGLIMAVSAPLAAILVPFARAAAVARA